MKTTSIFTAITFLVLIGTNIIGQEINKLVVDKIEPFETMRGSTADIVQVLPGERIIEKTSLNGKTFLFCTEKNSKQTKNAEFSYALDNIVALTSPDGYSAPKWSPDGSKILFTKMNYTGLFVIDLTAKNKIIKLNMLRGAGFNATWSDDSKSIYYHHKTADKYKKYKSHTEVKSINILTGETTEHSDIDVNIALNSITSRVSAKSNSDVIVYLDKKTLMVKAQTLDGSKKWDITKDGRYYGLVLSPDRTKVLVHKNGRMFVYAIDGSGLISSLGRGIANSWSSDGKQILFLIDESKDGHAITGSDLYLTNSDGSQRWQLTNTPYIFEEWPDWSPDNKQIVFSDVKTGTIYIADLIKNPKGD